MSGSQLIPTNTFATQSGNIALSLLDTNFSQVASFLNNPNNYTNYLVDSGGANAYVVTFPTGVIPSSYTAGLTVVMKVANANTGASTLNVNSLGTKNILNPDASSLSSGQLASSSLVMVVYDGTQFILLGGSATNTSSQSYNGFKNRIINGAMVIDQRWAGSAVTDSTASNPYTVDRWSFYGNVASKVSLQQNQGSVTPPVGFTNYMGLTVTSAYTPSAGDAFRFQQIIEGYNIADLAWGTANAKTVTISFWAYSSLTGTHSGALSNSALDRSYPFTFTISSANTWTYISITVAGDTSGTWGTTNGNGIRLFFNMGCGSTTLGTAGAWASTFYAGATGSVTVVANASATFKFTGVQLEKGSTATSFDYRPYGTELALCQRYFSKSYSTNTAIGGTGDDGKTTFFVGTNTTNPLYVYQKFPVSMRAGPTMTVYDLAGTSGKIYKGANGKTVNTIYGTTEGIDIGTDDTTSANALYYFWAASSEL